MKYKNLNELIQERGIRKSVIARRIGITEKTLEKKLNGQSPFTWEQVCDIQKIFFPDQNKDTLFLPMQIDESA